MVTSHDFREILSIMALIAGFSIAVLVLPDNTQPTTASIVMKNVLPPAQPGTGVEKIRVPVHTLFADQ